MSWLSPHQDPQEETRKPQSSGQAAATTAPIPLTGAGLPRTKSSGLALKDSTAQPVWEAAREPHHSLETPKQQQQTQIHLSVLLCALSVKLY